MSLTNWIITYIADIIFFLWIVFLGGSSVIGDTAISGIFTFMCTLKWRVINAEGVELFGWLIIIVHTIFFIIGITTPEFRALF